MDSFGNHALVCCGGGDRTRRHNLLRNMVYYAASSAHLNPELEKPGLLPQRPVFGSMYENGSCRLEKMIPILVLAALLTSSFLAGGLGPLPPGILLSLAGSGWIL